MKKLFLLLVFVTAALCASAMGVPVKAIDLQNLPVNKEVSVSTPEAPCMVCATCDHITLCAFGGDCTKAGNLLAELLKVLECPTDY